MPSGSSDRGLIAESAFCTEALKQGISIAIVLGNSKPYDVVTIYKNKLLRIQIKSAAKSSGHFYQISTDSYKYPADAFDFFAFCLVDINEFYIAPRSEISAKTIRIYHERDVNIRYGINDISVYLNKWDYLR